MNNVPMFATGSVLTGLGLTAAIATPIVSTTVGKSNRPLDFDFGPVIGLIAGEVGAITFLGVGIPLMAVGGHSVPDRTAAWRIPTVSAGLGTVHAKWVF